MLPIGFYSFSQPNYRGMQEKKGDRALAEKGEKNVNGLTGLGIPDWSL